jgi:hypothetical protein
MHASNDIRSGVSPDPKDASRIQRSAHHLNTHKLRPPAHENVGRLAAYLYRLCAKVVPSRFWHHAITLILWPSLEVMNYSRIYIDDLVLSMATATTRTSITTARAADNHMYLYRFLCEYNVLLV